MDKMLEVPFNLAAHVEQFANQLFEHLPISANDHQVLCCTLDDLSIRCILSTAVMSLCIRCYHFNMLLLAFVLCSLDNSV